MRRTWIRLAIASAAFAISLVQAPVVPAAPAPPGSFFSFTSDPGDYIGLGQSRTFTPADSSFTADLSNGYFSASIFPNDPSAGLFWFVDIAAPPGEALAPGVYPNAVRAAFRGPGQPGLDVSGDGRGCNEVAGTFTVNTVALGPTGDILQFDATFEQHCEGAPPALRGEIRIGSGPVTPPSGKATICHRTHSKKHPFVVITVSRAALRVHAAHGDTLAGADGSCPGAPIP